MEPTSAAHSGHVRAFPCGRLPWDTGRLAFTLDGVLSPAECAALRARADAAGWAPSPMRPFQTGLRARLDDGPAAEEIFERLRGFLPPVWRRCEVAGLTPTFRLLKYRPGDGVFPHPDTSGGDRHTPVAEPNFSFFTCLLNLNEGYEGCETHLLPTWANSRLDLWPQVRGGCRAEVETRVGRRLVACVP